MKLELYKPYRAQAGHKTVVVEYNERNGLYRVYHCYESNISVWHFADGTNLYSASHNLIAEWQEPKPPRTCEFWVSIYPDGDDDVSFTGPYRSKRTADHLASSNRIDCKRFVWTEGE